MHLTSEDKRAARDGFAYVVLVGGKRKCYCTKHSEAKAEAGKSGKIVSLGRMRYTTQNPSSSAKQRARGVRRYRQDAAIYEAALEEQDKLIKRALRQGTPASSPYVQAKMKERKTLAKWAKEHHPSLPNPSARKRSNPKRRYVVAYGGGDTAPLGAFSSKAEAKAAMLDKVARGKLVGGYVTLEKPKYRNPNSSGVEYSWERVAHIDPRVALQDARNALDTISKSRRQGETIRELLKRDAYLRDRFTAALEYLQRRGVVGPLEAERYMSQNPWEAKRPATRYGVTVTNPRKYKHGKAAQLERLILRVSAHGKLTETQLQEILQGIRRAYPAGPKATAQKHIVGLIAKAKEQRIWPKVYNRLARL